MIPRAAPGRLSQIAQHLAGGKSPYIAAQTASPADLAPPGTQRRLSTSSHNAAKMSSQPDHPTLLIPGPIEFDDAVLQSMSHYR